MRGQKAQDLGSANSLSCLPLNTEQEQAAPIFSPTSFSSTQPLSLRVLEK